METARKAAKTLSQACKNFLPAQGAKMEVRKSAKELINHKLQIFDFLLQFQESAPHGTEIKHLEAPALRGDGYNAGGRPNGQATFFYVCTYSVG